MLTSRQIELIHREIDGENTPEESIEIRALVASEPEAASLMASLQNLDALFGQVPAREPSPRVRQQIQNAMSLNSRASRKVEQKTTQSLVGWAIQQWNGVTNLMEKSMLTKRVMIGATTAVAVVAIIGYLVVDYKPSVYDAGTVGATSGMSGVQKADRFRGRTMTEKDITLSNPAISTLLQDDKVLKLVQSEAFHDALNNDAFRNLVNSNAFHDLANNKVFHDLLNNDAFHDLAANDAAAFNVLLVASNEASRGGVNANELSRGGVQANDAARNGVLSAEAYRNVVNSQAYHDIMSNAVFHDLAANPSFHDLLANPSFHDLLANPSFHDVLNNDAFLMVLNNDAFHDLQNSDAFMAIAHDANLSDLFLNEAAHVQARGH
ncbi:MAG TPA: hypothetical protein VM099_13780 [Gemmatimonadaceae bacterium]|nr:hypothetical protein [Gemmatimonadaceae bacterium]